MFKTSISIFNLPPSQGGDGGVCVRGGAI
jgi:hypothetical protein